ncbi:MAG TPA: hypothetical protein VFY28_03150 [Candidatus Paceibacterota bacterium]|nr:hypothetical protein [Candidatus Paceibacterota bacterium]
MDYLSDTILHGFPILVTFTFLVLAPLILLHFIVKRLTEKLPPQRARVIQVLIFLAVVGIGGYVLYGSLND